MDSEDGGQVGPGWCLWAPRGADPPSQSVPNPRSPTRVLPGAMGTVEVLPPGSVLVCRHLSSTFAPRRSVSVCPRQLLLCSSPWRCRCCQRLRAWSSFLLPLVM